MKFNFLLFLSFMFFVESKGAIKKNYSSITFWKIHLKGTQLKQKSFTGFQ